MSRIAFNGNALGTGTVTIASPNTNSDRTVTLPDETGTVVLSGGALGTPSSGNGSNLTNLNASNLASGTVPDARFPATLPAASGANLTALNGTNISSGTVAVARLAATGTPSASTYLRGDSSWATVSGGVTSITAGNGLTGGVITTSGTIALDYYTGSTSDNTSFPLGSYIIGAMTTNSAIATVTGIYPYFYGFSSLTTMTTAGLSSLTKLVEPKGTKNVDVIGNGNFYFIYDSDYPVLSAIYNEFGNTISSASFSSPTIMTLSSPTGLWASKQFRVYKYSGVPQIGPPSVNYQFKY